MDYYNLIAFDLDGTLIEGHVDRPVEGGPFRQIRPFFEVVPLANRISRIQELAADGVDLAVCTNKAGVAFGHQNLRSCVKKRFDVCQMFGVDFAWFECYTHPEASLEKYRCLDWRRKPGGGMIEEAMAWYGASVEKTLYVGDMETDRQAAESVGVDFCWSEEFFM